LAAQGFFFGWGGVGEFGEVENREGRHCGPRLLF
jgi:hypothetical protein